MIHENIELTGSLSVTGSLTIPNYPSSASHPTPITGSMYNDTGLNAVRFYDGVQWRTLVSGSTASAEEESQSGIADIEYLVVAGGGGTAGGRGGGGAGGLLSSSLSSIESGSSITLTVGAGGGTAPSNGSNSSIASAGGTSFATITTIGGGSSGVGSAAGSDGGSGGGGGHENGSTVYSGGAGTSGQGNDGGDSDKQASGGGGGAGEAGAAGTNPSNGTFDGRGGNGGDGLESTITGTSTYYAGGGGGYGYQASSGTGGQGGGGNGSQTSNQENGDANTGGGAGSGNGGNGGSGVAILAYDSGSINAAGGIVGDAGNGRKYHQFNSSDTFKVGSTSDFQIVTDSLELHLDAGDFASRGTSTWTDLSGNSRNGTVNNATLGTNFYYTLNGSTSTNIVGSASGISGNSARTVEAWYKLSNTDDIIINLGNQSFSGNTEWSLSPNGTTLAVYGGVGANDEYMTGFSTSLTSGNWTHLVVTWDANNPGTLKGYVNGTLEVTLARSSGEAYSTDNGYEIGGWSNNDRPYNGDIAQIRVYSDVLTDAEVLQNYNATKTNFV